MSLRNVCLRRLRMEDLAAVWFPGPQSRNVLWNVSAEVRLLQGKKMRRTTTAAATVGATEIQSSSSPPPLLLSLSLPLLLLERIHP